MPTQKPKESLFTTIILGIYNAWAIFWFVGIFVVLFPFEYICLQVRAWHPYVHHLNRLWAALFFPIIGKPLRIKWLHQPDLSKPYVFVANHFSYLDVAVGMGVVKNYFAYVGKSSVKKIPLLGYMFRKHHIQVDRSDKNSRSQSVIRGMKALQEGRSIFIMPEGGIISTNIPQMHQPFKDGAFLLAIENQVPIVPITFVNLHEIMPNMRLLWGIPRIVVHPPISTIGKTRDDLEALKQEVYQIIQSTINKG